MGYDILAWLSLLLVPLALFVPIDIARGSTVDLGHGFLDHGVATPVSNQRGTIATVDGEGRNIVLVWLFDHRGCYSLLWIDAETGKSTEYPIPFPHGGDCPYTSLLSSRSKLYTHFNSHFVEFDPAKRQFTFIRETTPRMAMGMTEDDNGVIWSVTCPQSGVVSYDPTTGECRDYGQVYPQNWQQYQRSVAADDKGWVYFGVGNAAAQIVAFDPMSGKVRPILTEKERPQGTGYVYRDLDGKVYGHAPGGDKDGWIALYGGAATKIGTRETRRPKPIITGDQGLFHGSFPDGKLLRGCDLSDRRMVVEHPGTGETQTVAFDYTSEGAYVMGVATAPDNTLCGGTSFPMRFFSYNPVTDQWVNRAAYGQWNVVSHLGDRFFVGAYGYGVLLEWAPSQPWVISRADDPKSNPLVLAQAWPTIGRPHDVLPYPGGELVILAGTPAYGYTGGGLMIWSRTTKSPIIIEHDQVIPDQSTFAMAPLPDGKMLAGTTTSPGGGGEKRAAQAELYIMDLGTQRVVWREAVFPGVQHYTDLCVASSGLVYGFVDRQRFFVFDPVQRKVLHEQPTEGQFGLTCCNDGPRVFVQTPSGSTFALFGMGIARVNPQTHAVAMVAESPVPIVNGGDYLDGRIYFASGSHLYSWAVAEPARQN